MLRTLLVLAALTTGIVSCRESVSRPGSHGSGTVEAAPAARGQADAARAPDEVPTEGLALIDEEDLRAHLSVLASDQMEGRRSGTAGADRAAAYLAGRLAHLDLTPLGSDTSFLQRFAMPMTGEGGRDSTQNVVALVRGSDPALRSQMVAIGAHYDHLGVGAPVEGDSIYNGADDDGSGVVALLEIAQAMSRGPRPRRSVLLVFHGGEEEGLLGSFHFTDRPPLPRDSIVAQLNVDMIGRNAADSLSVIGAGRISSELDGIVRRQAPAAGLHLDYTFDAPDHPERLYYRSDHYNYAQYGIPVAFFFAGLHPDYHQPSDEISRIDFGKLEKAAELVYRVAWEVANRPERLERNRPSS